MSSSSSEDSYVFSETESESELPTKENIPGPSGAQRAGIKPKKTKQSPAARIYEELRAEMELLGHWSEDEELAAEFPRNWEVHGDCVVLPMTSMVSPCWMESGLKVWAIVCDALKVKRIARKKAPIANDGYRTPAVDLLYGFGKGALGGWVTKKENGIKYSWDIMRCMFSCGNITEKLRIASWDCSNKCVVDLYAGIGYFTLTYLMHSKADFVHAVEWNFDAVAALRYNLLQNKVENKCKVYHANNEEVELYDIADHVNLGIIPDSTRSFKTACRAISTERGGIIHVHLNVDMDPILKGCGMTSIYCPNLHHLPVQWTEMAANVVIEFQNLFGEIRRNEEFYWKIEATGIYKVKSYAPLVDHIVIDISCNTEVYDRTKKTRSRHPQMTYSSDDEGDTD